MDNHMDQQAQEMWKEFQKGIEAANKTRHQEMRLHQKPISEFKKMSVEDKRQALIEWRVQHTPFSIIIGKDGNTEPAWQFLNHHTVEERAQKVSKYEDYIDSLRGHSGLEIDEVKDIVLERRNALQEALLRNSGKTLAEVLSRPGFERFERRRNNEATSIRNNRTLELYAANDSYPTALLYSLFTDPPDYLKRSVEPNPIEPLPTIIEALLPERYQLFLNWLEHSAKHNEDGWLTLEEINWLNKSLSASRRVFNPKNSDRVDAGTVRGFLHKAKRYPQYQNVQARPQTGKAWRLIDWKEQRGKNS